MKYSPNIYICERNAAVKVKEFGREDEGNQEGNGRCRNKSLLFNSLSLTLPKQLFISPTIVHKALKKLLLYLSESVFVEYPS